MDPTHAILFEPVRIGPVTAPNRFYQTPHATGLGWQRPQAGAALRGMKAEGGWGVVCTEYCSIHPTSDDSPHGFLTLWDVRWRRPHDGEHLIQPGRRTSRGSSGRRHRPR